MRPKDAYRGKRRGRSDYTLICSRGFFDTCKLGDRKAIPTIKAMSLSECLVS